MPTCPDYPDDLERPFTRGELSPLGVHWRELAGPLWRRPFRDVYAWSGTDAIAARQRALEAAQLLPPEGAVGGWAAARLGGGIAVLDGRGPVGDLVEPVLLCLPPRLRVRRGPAVRPLRSALGPDDTVVVDGVRVTTPVRTAFDLARTSATLVGAVVALDVLARGHPDFLAQVARYAEQRRGWAGVPQLRRSVALGSPRSRSPGETRFRLFWVLDAGLPPPVVNASIFVGAGVLLGVPDLLDPETATPGEYDGSGHLYQRQGDRPCAANVAGAAGPALRADQPGRPRPAPHPHPRPVARGLPFRPRAPTAGPRVVLAGGADAGRDPALVTRTADPLDAPAPDTPSSRCVRVQGSPGPGAAGRGQPPRIRARSRSQRSARRDSAP